MRGWRRRAVSSHAQPMRKFRHGGECRNPSGRIARMPNVPRVWPSCARSSRASSGAGVDRLGWPRGCTAGKKTPATQGAAGQGGSSCPAADKRPGSGQSPGTRDNPVASATAVCVPAGMPLQAALRAGRSRLIIPARGGFRPGRCLHLRPGAGLLPHLRRRAPARPGAGRCCRPGGCAARAARTAPVPRPEPSRWSGACRRSP